MAGIKGDAGVHIGNWLRTVGTLAFIEAWELSSNPDFNPTGLREIRGRAGSGSFSVSVGQLSAVGCIGIYAKRGRYGGTYAAMEWAIHFANWLDPAFYLMTLRGYLQLQKRMYGHHNLRKRFARELAAENHRLPIQQQALGLPPEADVLVERRMASVESDLINLAMWGMTAREWRIKFPQDNARDNMRNYAMAEELKVVAALQLLSRELQEQGYTTTERLELLRHRAANLVTHYCNSEAKRAVLSLAQHKRGWGKYDI